MKKKSVRILAALLAALTLATVFTGCGKKEGNNPGQDPNAPDFVYVPTYVELPDEVTEMNNVCVVGDACYFTSNRMIDEDKWIYETELYSMKLDGTGLTKLENYARPSRPAELDGIEDLTEDVYVNGFCVDGQGNVWIAENASYYHYDLPEGFDPETGNQWEYYKEDGSFTQLRKLDNTGAELLKVDLKPLQDAAGENGFYINSLQADAEGNLFLSSDQTVHIISPEGQILGKAESDDWVERLIRLSDGTVAVGSYLESGYVLRRIDPAAKDWGESIEAPYNAYDFYPGGGDYLFTYQYNSNLFGYDAGTKETTKLINWINCDVNPDNLNSITVLEDGRIFCTSYNWEEDTTRYEMILMEKQDAASQPQKTILTLACMYLDYNLRSEIIKFNKSNQNCRIQVNDYSEYNTEDDYNAGLTKLSTEIISGNVPDLLDVNSLPIKQYGAKGLLEDLYPYIDNDPELKREDFFEPVFKALEMDGKLYQASGGFAISTMIGDARAVGEERGWNMEEFMQAVKDNPQVESPMGRNYTKNDFLSSAMNMGGGQYVDWVTGECRFDQGEFAKILEFANTFPKEYTEWDEDKPYVSDYQLLMEGKQLVCSAYFSDFDSIQMYRTLLGENLAIKGFPNAEKICCTVYLNGGLAITSKCKDKDAAWSFVRTLLTQDWQESGNNWNLPTNKNAYQTKLEEAMTPIYTTDENGNQVEESKGGWGIGDDLTIEIYATKQEDADLMMELIEAIGGTMEYDQKITEMVQEEAASFFSGQRSAEETAKIIQNRISTYVAEQR